MMNIKIFLFIMFLINILFLNFNNPLIMGMIMLLQTINMILLMGKIYYSFWFSYIIFLVFVGGLFILFIYVISLTYNNKFFSMKMNKILLMIFMIIFSIMFLLQYKNYFFLNNEMLLKSKNWLMKENMIYNLKFYNFPNNIINLMLIMYLFMLMIIVVKITNFFLGPIKTKI